MRSLFPMLIALVLTLSTAVAEESCTKETTATLESPAATFYVDIEMCQPGCLFSVWIYQESNGEPGLQRCSETQEYDGCCGTSETDTIFF